MFKKLVLKIHEKKFRLYRIISNETEFKNLRNRFVCFILEINDSFHSNRASNGFF